MMDMSVLRQMVEALLGQQGGLQRMQRKAIYERRSKHWRPDGVKATKRYADGRQMAVHNRKSMRKRK